MDPATGDLLAAVSYPLPLRIGRAQPTDANPYLDRARYGLYPPGSTFKVVTAMAALRKDPQLAHKTYECIRLPDNRVGNFIKGSKRPIRDDVQDSSPHGTVDMEQASWSRAMRTSRNWARTTWARSRCSIPPTCWASSRPRRIRPPQLKKSLPQSSYGQGQVVASPFQMARVAATVANGGAMPQGRWITDETNERTSERRRRFYPPIAHRRWRSSCAKW